MMGPGYSAVDDEVLHIGVIDEVLVHTLPYAAFTPSRESFETLFQLPYSSGSILHCSPVRTIPKIASMNRTDTSMLHGSRLLLYLTYRPSPFVWIWNLYSLADKAQTNTPSNSGSLLMSTHLSSSNLRPRELAASDASPERR